MNRQNFRVLNVAEKPSVAKEVARLLSDNQARHERTWYGPWPSSVLPAAFSISRCRTAPAKLMTHPLLLRSSQFNGAYCFPYILQNRQCEMVFTSVSGHLTSLEFPAQYRHWNSVQPIDLYHAPVIKFIAEVGLTLVRLFVGESSAGQHLLMPSRSITTAGDS